VETQEGKEDTILLRKLNYPQGSTNAYCIGWGHGTQGYSPGDDVALWPLGTIQKRSGAGDERKEGILYLQLTGKGRDGGEQREK